MKLSIALLSVVLACVGIQQVASLAVMSVDFGSEWMKVGIVSPGVPMEIALNKESKRKTPAVISFRDNVRLFGEDAQTVGLRFPKQAYSYLLDLLGKSIDHPLVKLYQERFPYYEIVPDVDRGTILFKQDDDTFFSPEELIAQFLTKAREFAESGAQQPIKECVLTVPGFFNQVERNALLEAAELAGLKVLQLINDYTAVALNYGIFRTKTFNETAQYVMFYDMGASSTTATLVSYQNVKTKERGFVETHPQVQILGVGYDRTLGGLEIQLRLRDYLAEKFNDMKKTSNNVFENPRALAKLFKEAGRLKNVLSANFEHYAQIEGLLDEQDFKILVTRDELESLIPDLLERVTYPVKQALKTSQLSIDIVNQVVLVGAGTRVPKIQEILQKELRQDLAKNLNTDEAAVMGAVYKAADLSTGFKVTKFLTKDAVLFPIQIVFQRETKEGIKTVKRTLFGLMNPYPQKKIITFNKHTDDFSFTANYADLDYLPAGEILNIGGKDLSEFHLTGVADALQKNLGENAESKGIKAHFNLDESGILNLVNVELVVEKTVDASEEEGTLSKIGSTLGKLFGGQETEHPTETPQAEDKPVHEIHDDDRPEDAKPAENKSKEDKATSGTEGKNATETKEVKSKIVTHKEPIKSSESILSINGLNEQQFEKSLEKIKKLDKIEKDVNRRASALNNLESFVIDVQNKLYEDEYISASTEEEVEAILKACSEVSDWLYEDGSEADADTYEKKLDEVQALTRDLFARVWEHRERPEALKAMNSMLNHSSVFLKTAKNFTEAVNPDNFVFKESEIEALDKLINSTEEWKEKLVREQTELESSKPPKLTVKSLMDKMAALDREVKFLVNKLRNFRPKKVDKKRDTVTNATAEEANSTLPEKVEEDEQIEDTVEAPEDGNNSTKEQIEPSTTEKNDGDSHSEL
ncbi:hypoxia up-regulated protein 1 [Dendroctonus ponderosae]|uniref:hypoxia up-regulated protein 1 n=1 Tax=Dendroctonus ponderosae TaxID=77166 RepID=UPI002035C033|nr:hypoxia up-regulated protein 1 [Dendroctonus ponderosae]XP_048521550.1 hypoxia up-regulated protein 1 [Dendroctonus ponderosae]